MNRVKRVLLCTVLALSFICATANAKPKYELVRQGSEGEAVQRIQMRLRDLGFLNFKPTGGFKAMTVAATIAFQKVQVDENGNWMAADGDAGEQTQTILFSAKARRVSIPANAHLPIGPSLHGTPKIKGDLVSWQKIKDELQLNANYKLYDYNTGKDFMIKYLGGENHGEVRCSSEEDLTIFTEIFGGEYNFSKRPVVLQLNADTFVAASLFGAPHSANGSPDDASAHTCLFFDGSKSHIGQTTDVEHQKHIYTAAGM